MILGIVGEIIILGLGISFLGGIIAIDKGCEVLNENIKKWD